MCYIAWVIGVFMTGSWLRAGLFLFFSVIAGSCLAMPVVLPNEPPLFRKGENPFFTFFRDHPAPFSLGLVATSRFEEDPLRWKVPEESQPTLPKAIGPVGPVTRALLANAGLLGFSTVRYWIQESVNKPDWEYQLTWHDQWRRLFRLDGVRFDDNSFEVNWTHSGAGAMYYQLARSSRLNMAQSMLATLACSTFWELISEFKEVVSVNDQFMTVGGSLSLGETTFQLGDYFLQGARTPFNETMGWVFGFLGRVNRLVFGIPSPERGESDALGFSLSQGHRFRFTSGVKSTRLAEGRDSNPELAASVHLELLHLGRSERSGTLHRQVAGPLATGFFFGLSTTLGGLNEYVFRTETHFAGKVHQHMQPPGPGAGSEGTRWYIGALNSFELIWRRYADFKDKLAIVHLLGPVFDLHHHRPPLTLRARTSLSADIGLISGHAFDRWSKTHDPSGVKTTLKRWGYYYGVGYSWTGVVELIHGMLLAGGEVRYHRYFSVEGLDRRQSEVRDDFALRDTYLSWQAYLGIRFPQAPFSIRFLVESLDRRGTIAPLRVLDSDWRFAGQLVLEI